MDVTPTAIVSEGFCANVARNPPDKSVRYGGRNGGIEPWKDVKSFEEMLIWEEGDDRKTKGGARLNLRAKQGGLQNLSNQVEDILQTVVAIDESITDYSKIFWW